jgi:CheY-like chemotaxis protein
MANILIIENRSFDRNLLTTILRTRGREIVEGSDGQGALATLAHSTPGRATLYTSDIHAATMAGMKPPFVGRVLYTAVVRERRPMHARTLEGRPEALGLPRRSSRGLFVAERPDRLVEPHLRLVQPAPQAGQG